MLVTDPNKFSPTHRTIKNNQLYLIDDTFGNIPEGNNTGMGLYQMDTRFLSCLEIRLNRTLPIPLLSSTETGYLSTIVYTNGQIEGKSCDEGFCLIPEERIQLKRQTVLNDSMFEQFTLQSYFSHTCEIEVSFKVNADFRDIFEVRHLVTHVRGLLKPPVIDDKGITYTYVDGTGQHLMCKIIWQDFTPSYVHPSNEDTSVTFAFSSMLAPLEKITFHLEIQPYSPPLNTNNGHLQGNQYQEAIVEADGETNTWLQSATDFYSRNEDFNDMMSRSRKDIHMLMTCSWWAEDGHKEFIAAGVPWFVTLFGRDSLIAARDCLLLNPQIARTTLKILAYYQGKKHNPLRDEEPGKILHELRIGELARMNEIPHTPYYGSVDATPLWIILLYDYFLWTRDQNLLEELWPNALAAMEWIDTSLADSPNEFLNYECKAPRGLYHQGWKDSHDSAMYSTGHYAEPPIALIEVQGYVYQAKKNMKWLAQHLGELQYADRMEQDRVHFKNRFNAAYWIPELEYFALGLDKHGKPIDVISSNPGHCLISGVMHDYKAEKTIERLMGNDMFNGWGIRTLSSNTWAYNPMSYHNGSIWPHDNAMIARGFAHYNRMDLVDIIFNGHYDAARRMHYKRLPELFCGFSRDYNRLDPPVLYPVACSPQAWAASSVLALIQSILHCTPQADGKTLLFYQPQLPSFTNSLRITNLCIYNAHLDLEFTREGQTVMLNILDREGDIKIIVVQ